KLEEKAENALHSEFTMVETAEERMFVIPPSRTRYLSEIAENNRDYDLKATLQAEVAQQLYGIYRTIGTVLQLKDIGCARHFLSKKGIDTESILTLAGAEEKKQFLSLLCREFETLKMNLDPHHWKTILDWENTVQRYKDPVYSFK